MENKESLALKEIHETLSLTDFCARKIGKSFVDQKPKTFFKRFWMEFWFLFSTAAFTGLMIGEVAFVVILLIGSTSVGEFVASLHIVGYGIMSLCKLYTIWSKQRVFKQLIHQLVPIWPAEVNEQEATIKQASLRALRLGQICYMFWNILGVSLYSTTPIALHVYKRCRGSDSDLGFVWRVAYPFDKRKPILHELAYAFETFTGVTAVWVMLSTDLMFSTMASNISMLLRLLQVKVRNLVLEGTDSNDHQTIYVDCYEEIVKVIKIHQRLIRYSIDLEEAFSLVNLINVLLSSVNICCVVFNIVLLEHWMDMSSKFFLGAVMTQVGILCWYADDIYRASLGVADAVYESGWYKSNTRCRRALLLLLQRSQKPLCFTAMKFRNITLTTYTSILTTSYSYFALLYTVYRE